MPTWTFFGRVLPERVPVTWQGPLEGSATSAISNLDYEFRIVIFASQAVVDLKIIGNKPDLASLRNIAKGHIQMITDLVGYMQGGCFEVEIVSAICQETKDWVVFGNDIPVLSSRRSAKQRGEVQSDLVIAIANNVAAQMALADFREAMRSPIGTGFFCYRAIEAMMQSIKEGESVSESIAWTLLREKLLIDRAAIDEVKRHADYPRHGKPSSITDAERAKVFELTDEIIRRYLEHLVRNRPLSDQEFTMLTN